MRLTYFRRFCREIILDIFEDNGFLQLVRNSKKKFIYSDLEIQAARLEIILASGFDELGGNMFYHERDLMKLIKLTSPEEYEYWETNIRKDIAFPVLTYAKYYNSFEYNISAFIEYLVKRIRYCKENIKTLNKIR